ncbi:MAG: hypothetical protein WCH20_07000 [Nitrospira sp.]
MNPELQVVDVWKSFEGLNSSYRDSLADLGTPLRMALGALVLAKDLYGISYLSVEEVHDALEAGGVGIEKKQVSNAISRAGSKISRRKIDGVMKYRATTQGRRDIEDDLLPQGVQVTFIESGRPRLARQRLGDLFGGLKGSVRICDPYYGIRSLDSLELIPQGMEVQFLTFQMSGKEDSTRVGHSIKDFRHERPKTELRRLSPPLTLHDRYILDDLGIKIVGHGIKDIGGKDSFIISIPRDLVEDLMMDLVSAFDRKWTSAVPL